MLPGTYEQALTIEQEFSIEIPDKEADAIHSGMFSMANPHPVAVY